MDDATLKLESLRLAAHLKEVQIEHKMTDATGIVAMAKQFHNFLIEKSGGKNESSL